MLSAGRYHQDVPRDYDGNLDYRQWLLRRASQNARVQRAFKRMASDDILWYVNACVWTYDPELIKNKVQPFITWPAQEEAFCSQDPERPGMLWAVEHRKDLFIEKSRRQGGSWICLLVQDWLWRFRPLNQFLLISRNANMVDGPTPDSLFWKLDFLDKWLPAWLRPRVKRVKMHLENLDNGSVMTGQATTGESGVGGRATMMLVDEFSRIKEDQELLDSTADTSNCRVFNSTHTGPGTAFFRQCERPNVRKLRLHWTQNPSCNGGLYRYNPGTNRVDVIDTDFAYATDYSFVMEAKPTGGPFPGLRSPWYDEQCERRGNARAIAMDLDIDARGSTSLFFDAYTISALIRNYAIPPLWQGDLKLDQAGMVEALVPHENGRLKLWLNTKPDGTLPRSKYAMGGDIAAGTGATPSCLALGDAETGEKVASYEDPYVEPKALAKIAVALCHFFHGARFCWEMNGPGLSFGAEVLNLGYRNIYYKTLELPYSTDNKVSDSPGWYPTAEAQRVVLEDYRSALNLRACIDRCELSLRECLDYKYNERGEIEHALIKGGADPTGARMNHGDRVIAAGLMWKMMKQLGCAVAMSKPEKARMSVLSLAYRMDRYENQKRELEAY